MKPSEDGNRTLVKEAKKRHKLTHLQIMDTLGVSLLDKFLETFVSIST